MVQRAASSSTALPRFLLSLSASSTSSRRLQGPANNNGICSRIAPASPPDSAYQSTIQGIELVAIRTWSNPSAAVPRITKHKPSAIPERKSASTDKDLRLTSCSSTTSLACSASSTTDPLSRGMTAIERQDKANQVWRGCWMSSQNTSTKRQKFRGGVWAVAFAAVIMVGTLTGAQLKSDKQKEQAIKEFRQISPNAQIAMLEKQRASLMEQKAVLQKKLDVFKERVQDRQQEQEHSKKR
ncbi:hypothetical protein V8C37DRAFT_418290 [Trichoderma ceciliae]